MEKTKENKKPKTKTKQQWQKQTKIYGKIENVYYLWVTVEIWFLSALLVFEMYPDCKRISGNNSSVW